ncbi:hypothetical protein BG015_009708 [Linnemannia schmuckeri]|uniref:Uncharacterized protein n=1 Tax=Linnemannia schmuckeri TaxID=64567 RepID=A0A9P5V9L7_9FUNG|nr:hypothetical protein BG015_009708 [Linnemannia schmuckeri]
MSTVALRRYRIWMLFLTFINGLVMIAFYGYSFYAWSTRQPFSWELRPTTNTYEIIGIAPRQPQPRPYGFYWQEWANIVTAGVHFITYIVALVSPYNLPKYLRASLVAIPVGLSLYVNIDYIVFVMGFTSIRSPLSCMATNITCHLTWSSRFMAIITGAFVLVEIVLTLRWGPLRPKEDIVEDDKSLVAPAPPQSAQLHPDHDTLRDNGAGINTQPQMTQV